jgi:hypothetical protein
MIVIDSPAIGEFRVNWLFALDSMGVSMNADAKRKILATLTIVAVLIAMSLAALPAQAQPYHVRAHTRVQTSGFGVCDSQYNDNDTTRVQAPSISSGPFTATSSACAFATTTSYGSAELGVLRGYSNFSSSTQGSPAGGSGQGTPESFGDTITVVSGSLPNGTQVTLEATLTFNRAMSGTPGNETNIQTSVSGPFGLYIGDNFSNPNPTQTVSTTTTWFIGFPLAIEVALNFQCSGTAFLDAPRNGSINIPSVFFTLKCLTPDTSYTTASGASYVPLLDADVNVSGLGNGLDIEPFVTALLAESTAASDLYHADFNGSGIIDAGDVAGFAQKLVGL